MIGPQIKTVERVVKMAQERRATYHKLTKRVTSAAFLQNYPAVWLVRLVGSGYLFEYIPETTTCSKGWAKRCELSRGEKCKCKCKGHNHGKRQMLFQ